MFIRMLSHAINVKQNGHSKNAFSWRYTLFLLIIIRFKTNMRNIRSIELSSGNGKLYRELAHLHLRNNDTDDAENAFKQAIRYTSQDSRRQDIEQEMVKLYKSVGKLEDLEQKVETGETLTFEIQKDRAKGLLDSKDYEKASIKYTKTLDMITDEYEQERIYENLLEIYVKLGKNDLVVHSAKLYGILLLYTQ